MPNRLIIRIASEFTQKSNWPRHPNILTESYRGRRTGRTNVNVVALYCTALHCTALRARARAAEAPEDQNAMCTVVHFCVGVSRFCSTVKVRDCTSRAELAS